MNKKPKILKIYKWLYLVLGGIYFLFSILLIFWIIDGYSTDIHDSFFVCSLIFFITEFVFCVLLGFWSLKNSRLFKKDGKPNINSGILFLSLLLFSFPMYLFTDVLVRFPSQFTLWPKIHFIFLFLIFTINIVLIVINEISLIKGFWDESQNNK